MSSLISYKECSISVIDNLDVGFWILVVPEKEEFKILIKFSYQSILLLSFQLIIFPARLTPSLSNTSSVVVTLEIFIKPFALIGRVLLYPKVLAIWRILALRSAVSIKFSLVFMSSLNAKLCPRYATKSKIAMNSELAMKSLNLSG